MANNDIESTLSNLSTTTLNPPTCPSCHATLPHQIGVGARAKSPKAGDVTVCTSCAEALQFTEVLDLAILPVDALEEEDQETLAGIQSFVRAKNGLPN